MRILILSFYYSPDLSACSFRTTALVRAILEHVPALSHVEVITTLPHRYDSFTHDASESEESSRLRICRIALPSHGSGMLGQAKAFAYFAREAVRLAQDGKYDLVYGTSSRLMTAALSAYIARKKRLPLYLDIRDILPDTIKDVLPRGLAWLLRPFLSALERWTITRADSVNLVSRGFEGYFVDRFPTQRYSFFTNGVDDEFVRGGWEGRHEPLEHERRARVVYAGNIGEGQGLHSVLPKLAARLEGRAEFVIIGDGGRKRALEAALAREGCWNVQLLPPMKREQLIEAYRQADVLFLHLNDYPAFKRVLPSKVFEYAATGRPILAGVAGYAASFVAAEIENAVVFPPCAVERGVQAFGELRLENVERRSFLEKYARASIMNDMVADIVLFLPHARG